MEIIPKNQTVELFIATTGAIGANVGALRDSIKEQMGQFLWIIDKKEEPIKIIEIHIVKLIHKFIEKSAQEDGDTKIKEMLKKLREVQSDSKDKYISTILHQDLGDLLRREKSKDFLARLAIKEIKEKREESPEEGCTIFLIHSLKHEAEAELLRQVYRENFFLIGAFMEEKQRKARWRYKLTENARPPKKKDKQIIEKQLEDAFARDYLRKEWNSIKNNGLEEIRNGVDDFWGKYGHLFASHYLKLSSKEKKHLPRKYFYNWVSKFYDSKKNESWAAYSQNMRALLPRCDAIIHTYPATLNDKKSVDLKQLNRVLQLLFGNFHHTPTNEEHGLFMAYSAMLHSGDLGRQVGAVITNEIGDVLAIGYNEVPCFGGLCSESNFPENRDFREEYLSHRRYLDEVIDDLFLKQSKPKKFAKKEELEKFLSGSKIENAIEHYRSIHAEMGAIVNAAKSGVSIKNGILFVTTFPCHLCMSHIIASGISRVVYLEPYEKSHGVEYYKKSIVLNPILEEKIKIMENNKTAKERSRVIVEHFTGVLPNRYRNLFFYDSNRFDKKNKDKSKPVSFKDQDCKPFFRIHGPFLEEKPYIFWEQNIIDQME